MSHKQQEQSALVEQLAPEDQGSIHSYQYSDTTIFVTTTTMMMTTTTTTRHHTVVIARPNPTLAPISSITAAADAQTQTTPCSPGATWSLDGQAKAAIVFWELTMAILIIIFVGYIFLFFWLWRTSYVKGRTKARQAAESARLAVKEAVAVGAPTDELGSRIIGTARRGTRRSSMWQGKGKAPAFVDDDAGGNSYEMDDLYHRRYAEQNQDDATLHVATQSRSRSELSAVEVAESDRTNREAGIWAGLSARSINDVDDRTRIKALQQMREMQQPVQRNFGDDNQWSSVTTTEALREMYRVRRNAR